MFFERKRLNNAISFYVVKKKQFLFKYRAVLFCNYEAETNVIHNIEY